MSFNIIENPLRKEIHKLSTYSKLLSLDSERMKKIEGDNVEWLIDKTHTPSSSSSDNQVYQSLQNENEWLWETVDLLNKGWYQNKLWLDSIEDETEADNAINDLLEHVIIYWRTYLESDDPKIFEKMPVLGSRFSQHENRVKAFDLITLMVEVLRKKLTIDELLMKWHGGKTWDAYSKKDDYDNSLWCFTQLLYLKKKYHVEKPVEEKPKKETSTIGTQTGIEKPKQKTMEELIEKIPGAFPK